MAKISLASYSIRVRNDNNQFLSLNGEKINFMNCVVDFIKNYKESYNNDESREKLFKFDSLDESNKEVYYNDYYKDKNGATLFEYVICRMKTGEYGYSSEIVDSQSKQEVYIKEPTQAEVLPFYILIAVPTGNSNDGIIVFQNISAFGVKTLFQKYLDDYIKKNIDQKYRIEMGNLAPSSYIERYIRNGLLKELVFVKNSLPVDKVNILGSEMHLEEKSYSLVTLKNPGSLLSKQGKIGRVLTETGNKIMSVVKGSTNLSQVAKFGEYDFDNLKMVFDYNGSRKTINLDNIQNVRITDDVTKKIDLKDGHPTFNSIKKELVDTAEYYLLELGNIEKLEDC